MSGARSRIVDEHLLDLNKEIWAAVWHNDLTTLGDLLKTCPREAINHKHDSGKTALHTAAMLTHIDCAKMLLDHGADVHIDNIDRMTALHFASYSNLAGDPKFLTSKKKRQKEVRMRQVEMVRLLLSAGANPLKASVRGETAEYLAMENEMPEVASLLKDESQKYRVKQQELEHRNNYNALRKAAEAGDLVQFTAILRTDTKCLNERCPSTGQTLLYLASASGNFEVVNYIISNGGKDILESQSTAKTLTPLHIACQKGFTSIVRLLMEKQALYVKFSDAEGRTPLHDACKYGYVEIVHFLLCCASPVEKFGPNSSELLNTVTGELHAISPTSIGKYINPINTDKRLKQSPLHDAAEAGNLEIIHLLLAFLEKGTVRDIDLNSNYSLAPRYENQRTLSPISSPPHQRRMEKHGSLTTSNGRPLIAGIDSSNRAGYTPFHLAARKHHYTVCDELLSAGAHLNAIIRPDLDRAIDVDYTLLVAAVNCNDLELIRYLLNRGGTDDRNRALRRTLRYNYVEAAGLLLSYSQGVQVSPNDHSSDYHSSEKESHLLDIVWQHKELTLVHPEWIQSVLKENRKPPISSVLITLDVSRNKLTSLPYEIFELSNLIEFDASHNQLTQLPSSPSTQQQKLVSSQDGTVVEEGRWSCTRLRKLNVSHNKLVELPSHIFNLPSLEELRATNNSISVLPTRMWNSPRISNIYLDHNKISHLPNPTPLNLSEESNLEGSVRGDKVVLSPSPQHTPLLPTGSNSIINSAVTSFSESYNSYGPPITIEHIGMRFSTSKTERWLNTLPTPNKKGHFLATIDRKMHQRRVQSRKSMLEDPDSTELDIPQKPRGSKESNLTSLSLNYNSLHSLPPALACYAPTLKKLYIAHNNIKELGVVHDFPPNLEILDASANQLTVSITPSLTSGTYKDNACYSPHSQTVTVLDDQELICPHRIHKTLRKLSTLKLSHNELCTIILFRLPLKQNSVGLDKSQEETNEGGNGNGTDGYYGTVGSYGKNSHGSGSSGGSGPGVHHQLKNSRDSGFSVSGTRDLKDQTSRDFTEVAPPLYPELSNLDISHNKLSSIPPEISQIHTLGSLNVSYNELVESLPLELCRLENLFQLDYAGLELVRPTVSDLDKFHRTNDKLNFMRALMESSARNYKMKLMLVGLQKQGKTTLLNRLREVSEKGSVYNPTFGERTNSLYYSLTPQDGVSGPKDQLSTVGVDLGEWRYSKDLAEGALVSIKSKFGKTTKVNPTITFYTWDFAGQEEYYATHQCFLTYRSLYLLLWNANDDRNGIKNLSFWLHNIQSRAPGSPVIIIGTHLDRLGNTLQEREEKKLKLEGIIREMYKVGRPLHELEEHGLPVIKDIFFVGMPHGKSEGIQELRKQVYDIAMMLSPNERRGRTGKSGEQKLLDQPVPAKYIKLEDCVHQLRRYCRESSKTPVMNVQEFRENTRDIITDPADLQHAVTYLHENGVLLHYNTPTLEHLYFVDPQWLVDMLAHIVTVPEVNRYIKRDCQQSGILRVTNMSHIFRGQVFPSTYQSEYIELLGRFEVALALNSEQLLIPSFLPDTPRYTIHWYRTKFPRPAIKDVVQDYLMDEQHAIPSITSNDPIHEIPHGVPLEQSSGSNSSTDTPALHKDSSHSHTSAADAAAKLKYTGLLLRRLYFMLYMPSGFWPRLISRMMSNSSILELIRELLGHSLDDSEEELDANKYETGTRSFMTVVGHSKLNWSYWKTGIELWIEGRSVFRVSEILGPEFYLHCSGSPNEASEENTDKPKVRKYETPTLSHNSARQELQHFKTGVGPVDPWSDTTSLIFVFGDKYTSVTTLKRKGLEILVPDMICLSNSRDTQEGAWTSAKLLSRVVDFIDALLEDWFPGLGARNLLPDDSLPKVVRLVPCPLCIGMGQGTPSENKSRKDNSGFKKKMGASSKRLSKKEDRVQTTSMAFPLINPHSYAFLVEELVYTSKTSQYIECPNHKKIPIADLAPDLVFADIQYMVLDPRCVDRNKYIDSGGFGDIFYGFLFRNPTSDVTSGDPGEEVAIKVQANGELKGEGKTDEKHICMGGYLSMRAELSILESLDHPHIIKVLGLLLNPYSMLVEWAPLGSLHSILTTYWENNLSLQPHVLHNTICQVAEGLAYLHKKEIIYYDLKSPNILAFSFPTVQYLKSLHGNKHASFDGERGMQSFNSQDDEKIPIVVKVADMGISRYSVLGKSKGFRGTPGFMAPEILKFHGAESCDCKVDVFSMGMFLYELVAGHFPYEYQNLMDGQIEKLIVSGERPPLQKREITNPFFYLNCMRWCWQDDPRSRPSSHRLVDVLKNPSLPRLIDAFPLGISNPVSAVCLCQLPQSVQQLTLSSGDFSEPRSPERKTSAVPQGEGREEIWICFKNERMGQATVVSFQEHSYLNIETVYLCPSRIKCLCAVKDTVWVCSEGGELYVYQASTHKLLFERTLVIPGDELDAENEITSIVYFPVLSTVVVSTFSGAILCFDDQPSETEERDCEGFSVHAKCFLPVKHVVKLHYYVNTIIAIPTRDEDTFQVWCGCLSSIVAVINVKDHTFSAPEYMMSPFSQATTPEEGFIHHLAHTFSYNRQRHVWSLLNPSSILQCWDAENRKPIPEKEYRFCDYKEDPVQSMLAFEEYIYLGTLNGRIYIFDTQTCTIKCELQGHDKTVYSLTRMNGVVQPGYWMPRILGKTLPRQRDNISYKKLDRVNRHKPVIVSIGTGLKDITDRPMTSSLEDDSRDTFMLAWLGEYSIGSD